MISTDIPIDLIDPNPWQPRTSEDPEHIRKLADSIALHDLLQIPSARQTGGRYQLAFGHSRLAACKLLSHTTFPLNIVDLDDQGMANAAAQENVARKDLSAIETARAIARYIQDFGETQAAAGAVYGYTSQASVSNLLRLLQLPSPVLDMVHGGDLAERLARRLVQAAKIDEAACIKIAQLTIKVEEGRRESELDRLFWNWLRSGQPASDMPWEMDWLGKAGAIVPEHLATDECKHVAACRGCPFLVEHNSHKYCMGTSCYAIKLSMHAETQLQAASKKTKIAALAPGEKGTTVWAGDYSGLDAAKALIAKRHESLRLAPVDDKDPRYQSDDRKRVLGGSLVKLVTVNKAALERDCKSAIRTRTKSDYEVKNAQRLQNAKHVRALTEHAGALLADAILPPTREVSELLDRLMPVIELPGRTYAERQGVKKSWHELKDLERRHLVARAVLINSVMPNEFDPPTPKAAALAIEDIAKGVGGKLVTGWAEGVQPPKKGKK